MRPKLCVSRMLLPLLLLPSVLAAQSLYPRLSPEYKKWLREDVRSIIKDQERIEFLKLADDQRDQLLADFWARRNPNPTSKDNSFKQEHYRRLSYANEHFAAAIPGFETDRGRIYILYGPPDRIDPHPSPSDGYPYEVWHYPHIKGSGDEVSLKFVDESACGAHQLENEPPDNQ